MFDNWSIYRGEKWVDRSSDKQVPEQTEPVFGSLDANGTQPDCIPHKPVETASPDQPTSTGLANISKEHPV
jgi:hypothetical protein